ncbi:MarR family winged helix-turn-helix transcriptional regulator [Fodinicola feengrottensis]|uniref:MarR family winged helix-turn-helix transcriptional regulator n=1 Tax=Fodinicola feengrottensis TaxID=435914 RepID=UPI0024427534|nr:MarR family winged helix-turn-helix transcriptional regulator [Fodinicola feengrottensis]
MSRSEGDEALALDGQLCFALYAASRAVTDVYRPLLAQMGLTYPQYLALLVLWERSPVPVKEIGAALQLDYGTVSPLLKRLEQQGLITRQRAAGDERSVTVALTADGDALRLKARAIPPHIQCAVGLDERAAHDLIETLRALTDSTRAR